MIDEFTSRNSDLIQRLEVSEPEFRALRFAPSNNDSFVGCNAYLRRHMVDKVPFLTTWLTEDGLWFEKRDALKKFFKVVPGEILIEDVNPDVFNKLFIHLQNPDVLAAMRERSLDEWRKAMDQIAREDL